MKIKHFLLDKLSFIIFYIILMTFVLGMIFITIDGTATSNLLYTAIVSLILFICFLIYEYIKIRLYYNSAEDSFLEDSLEWINNLPTPITYEQNYSKELLQKAYQQSEKINYSLIQQHRENIEFINMWVHEIKVPVAATQLIISNNLEEPSEMTLTSIKEEIEKIEKFVEQILYYSRISDFSKDYLITSSNMSEIIKTSIKGFKKQFIGKDIAVKLDNIDYIIDTDKKWVSYILDQLLSNALKYTPKNGEIKAYMEETPQEYTLTVEDNGIGIPKDELKRIFDRGFTGTTGRTNRSSTGMGLYLAQNLCQKLGYLITVDSKVNIGSKFTIHFPKWNDYLIK